MRIAELNESLDRGFIHYRFLSRDPAFGALRQRVAMKYRDACIAFTDAGGQLFGL